MIEPSRLLYPEPRRLILPSGPYPSRVWAPPARRIEPASAAYTFVRQQAKDGSDTVSSLNLTIGAQPGTGNTLMLAIGVQDLDGSSIQVSSITETNGTWSLLRRSAFAGISAHVEIWQLLNAPANLSLTCTINLSAGQDTNVAAIFAEFSGGATSSAGDGVNSNTGTSTTPTSGSLTPSQAADLSFAAMVQINASNETPPGAPSGTPSGYTALTGQAVFEDETWFKAMRLDACWKAVADTTAQNPGYTITSGAWAEAIALSKVAPAAGYDRKKSSMLLHFN